MCTSGMERLYKNGHMEIWKAHYMQLLINKVTYVPIASLR